MLEGISNLEWEEFEHAYGTAEDVPEMLEGLTSSDADIRKNALEDLYNNICHQGSVYEAATHTIPFLIELVSNEAVEDRHELLKFLRRLAADSNNYAPPYSRPVSDEQWLEQLMDEQRGDITPPYKAVRLGNDNYLPLLNDDDPLIRIGAAYLLARFSHMDDRIPEALWARFKSEDTSEGVASLILALGETGKKDDKYRQVRDKFLQNTKDPICRFAAAVSLASSEREEAPAEVLTVFLDALRSPHSYSGYENLPWPYEDIIGEAHSHMNCLGQKALPAVPQLLEMLRKENCPIVALSLSSILLNILFTEEAVPDSFDKLSEDQRQTLVSMVENNRTWRFDGNTAELLNRYGLPSTRDGLRRFVEQ